MKAKATIVDDFIYCDRRCVVVEINNSNIIDALKQQNIKNSILLDNLKLRHNGYIEVTDEENNLYGDVICDEEITYYDGLEHIYSANGRMYIGFDTAHLYNNENPETKTRSHVLMKCKNIANYLGYKLKKV